MSGRWSARCTVYRERERSAVFRAQWHTALIYAVEKLEGKAYERAVYGVKKGVWMRGPNGKPVMVEEVTEFSDRLAEFLLRAHCPEKYRENFRAEVTGKEGGAVKMEQDVRMLPDAELERIVSSGINRGILNVSAPVMSARGEPKHIPESNNGGNGG